jgi:putative membrane protein
VSQTSETTGGTPRRRWLRPVAIIAVALVPLAFAGLFVGALSQADTSIKHVPAAIVNGDKLIYQTGADGKKTPIFAGRQLVTELTGGNGGFDWTVSNTADAKAALKNGTIDAILTVPKDFSKSILSLSSSTPTRAKISIQTDDAHSYLTGALAKTVGDGMTSTFGKAITQQYISGIYASVGSLGSSLGTAADGAGKIATSATTLGTGLGTLASGSASSEAGAAKLSTGIVQYTGGVDSLNSGLSKLNTGASQAVQASQGISQLSAGVATISQQLSAASAAVPQNPIAIQQLSTALASASAQLTAVSGQNAQAASGVAGGVSQSAAGAAKLSAGSAGLRSGASSLATGLGSLSGGVTSAQSGATQLASGATDLATGLRSGADKVPASSSAASAKASKIASDPISFSVVRDNRIGDLGKVIATFFVPLGLWVGAIATFLVLRPISQRALASTATTGRLVRSVLVKAGAIAIVQALLLVGLLHGLLGVPLSSLPATLGFSVLTALAVTAFHYLLTIGLGRAGLIVSLLVLAVQLTSTGGLYPVQVLAAPFQLISPLLPLTYGVQGMQSIIAGGNVGSVITAAASLLAFGVGSLLISLIVMTRVRRAGALGLTARAARPVRARSVGSSPAEA